MWRQVEDVFPRFLLLLRLVHVETVEGSLFLLTA